MPKLTTLAAIGALAFALGTGAASAQGYDYGQDCHDQNARTGTVLGAIAGGVIGNQFGHGRGRTAATVGGVVLGGIAGNQIAGDMPCEDRRYAFAVYQEGFDGPIGERYEWRNPHGNYGYFTPVREYEDSEGYMCRDFEEGVWRGGEWHVRTGTACREHDGRWYFR